MPNISETPDEFGKNCAANAACIAGGFVALSEDCPIGIPLPDVSAIADAAYLLACCEDRDYFHWEDSGTDWESVCNNIALALDRDRQDPAAVSIRHILLPFGFDTLNNNDRSAAR